MKINLFNNKSMNNVLSEMLSDSFTGIINDKTPYEIKYDSSEHDEGWKFNHETKRWELALCLPGFNKQDIEVSVLKDTLFIKASQSINEKYLVQKSLYSNSFKLYYQLEDSAEAEYKDGILKISFLSKDDNPNLLKRKIEVK